MTSLKQLKENIREAFNPRVTGGAQSGFGKKVEKKEKIEKKDNSVFGGKPYIDTKDFRRRVREYRIRKDSELTEEEVAKFAEEMFELPHSHTINPEKVKEAKKQLSYGKFGKFSKLSESEKTKRLKFIKKILGE